MFMLLSCHDMNLAYAAGGKLDLLMSNIGISAMHMKLLNNDRVVMYDRTDFGASNISLPNGKCRNNPNDLALKTDVWCSSGSATSDGTLVQTGGFNDGEVMVRNFKSCATCDWQETGNGLIQSRWYSANHLLPDGSNVLFINGAASGTAGWQIARNPVSSQVIYRPDNLSSSKFEVQNPNAIPRMYHSATVLLRDGRVLVDGSNPNEIYNFTGVLFPTDLSLEAFSPPYLDSLYANLQPRVISPPSHTKIKYGQRVNVRFTVSTLRLNKDLVKVTMVAPGFNTHSNTMNQRLLVLSGGKVKRVGIFTYQINLIFPNSGKLAPPGYCMLFVVHQDIPSEGIWIKIQ
ncbi:hypothetical protein T459_14724 [Capsicum annuum]|uniref:Uncharacterized protein n=1 Tax=Capsicum annuum TaxID=4072 RepID=A0A2G2ZI77_CAPAN|nr:hypothetical protein T459_14724 [Capsicum annuum]